MKIERKEDGTVWVDGVLVPGAVRDEEGDSLVLSGFTHTAMDESGSVFAYHEKPSCGYDVWSGNSHVAYLYTLPSGIGWKDSLREIGQPKQNVEHKQMTKEDVIDLLMLLSALESWSFAQGSTMPDYLGDKLTDAITKLRDEVMK